MVFCVCSNCGGFFERRRAEVNRAERLGRKVFCSKTCSTTYYNPRREFKPSADHLNPANRRDELSPFRQHLARLRSRKHEVSVTLDDLRDVWVEQSGVCPLTGWALDLPEKGTRATPRTASVDRIDNARGYHRDNIRWVACMANLARNGWSDEDVIAFGQAVAATHSPL